MTSNVDPRSLQKTVIDLQQRIDADHKYLAGHETRTRVVLIDPLLRSIGWDPEKPSQVQLEFESPNGRPDYVLMKEGRPVAIIEAKRLDTKLNTRDPGQVLNFTQDPILKECEVVAFTDGNVWVFFRSSEKWSPETAKITSDPTFETAWLFVECLSPSKLGAGGAKPNGNGPPPGMWRPLVGELPHGLPTRIRMGEAEPTEFVTWKQLYADVAEYLVSSGGNRLPAPPIKVTTGKNCAINDKPEHPNRKPFRAPVKLSRGMWLEAFGNDVMRRDYSRRLLSRYHDDPESVQVCFD